MWSNNIKESNSYNMHEVSMKKLIFILAIVMSDEVCFKARHIAKGKEGCYIMVKESVHQRQQS